MSLTVHEQRISAIYRRSVDSQELNQKEMAQDIHVSPQLLSHMLNGRRSMGIERVIDIADYLRDPQTDFEAAAELFHTPRPLNRKRRDSHPLSKMVGQDKEEMERIEIEKKFEVWDLLSISAEELTEEERAGIYLWLIELKDEISAEIAVFTSVCNRYAFDSRQVIAEAETRERND